MVRAPSVPTSFAACSNEYAIGVSPYGLYVAISVLSFAALPDPIGTTSWVSSQVPLSKRSKAVAP